MRTHRFERVPDTELRDAITEARALAASSEAARERLGELASEAARRLVDPASAPSTVRASSWQNGGLGSFVLVWWREMAFVICVAFAVFQTAEAFNTGHWIGRPRGIAADRAAIDPGRAFLAGAAAAVAVVLRRWIGEKGLR